MVNEVNKITLLTPTFRMSYASLLTPKQFVRNGKPQGDPSYAVNMIFEEASLSEFGSLGEDDSLVKVNIDTVCRELAAKQWPGQQLSEIFIRKPNGTTDWPLKKGANLIALEAKKAKPKDLSFLNGMVQIPAKGNVKYPPQLRYRENGETKVLDRENEEHVKLIKKLFASGNYASAEVNVMAQETQMGNFITFYLNKVMFRKTGKPLGGQSLMDRFDGIDGGESDLDPTVGDEDFGDI